MTNVESWFPTFVVKLTDSIRRSDWPVPGAGWWDFLRSRLVHHGVRRDEAEAACSMLFDAPPGHIDHIWPELLAAVKCHREARKPADSPDDRDAAKIASRDCPYCAGEGLLAVTHSHGGDPEEHCPPTLTAVCVCSLGRWYKAAVVRSLPPGRKAGMIDLAAVLDGTSAYRIPIDSAGWEAAAAAHWESLPESERNEARALVRGRLPELAHRTGWVDGIAKGWSYDPKFVAGIPPPPRDPSWKQAAPRHPARPHPIETTCKSG